MKSQEFSHRGEKFCFFNCTSIWEDKSSPFNLPSHVSWCMYVINHYVIHGASAVCLKVSISHKAGRKKHLKEAMKEPSFSLTKEHHAALLDWRKSFQNLTKMIEMGKCSFSHCSGSFQWFQYFRPSKLIFWCTLCGRELNKIAPTSASFPTFIYSILEM